ncbi:hypothetical protein HW432_05690 [Bacillus pumilus]|uniref:hypothetical protein n=1 Tax=Bacillus pumilus TaxID=1408 RepID=UPI0016079631|nr:hypothetical protein [Bacillus pumilus]MBB6601771.1 hypothetical protein [Bacillus pumilus]
MEQEKLNILNEQHETIGVADRSDIHAQGLWHVYLYVHPEEQMNIQLQKEEVAGLYRAKLMDAQQLFTRKCDNMQLEIFEVDEAGERRKESKVVCVQDFVPHEPAYYQHLFQAINQFLLQ